MLLLARIRWRPPVSVAVTCRKLYATAPIVVNHSFASGRWPKPAKARIDFASAERDGSMQALERIAQRDSMIPLAHGRIARNHVFFGVFHNDRRDHSAVTVAVAGSGPAGGQLFDDSAAEYCGFVGQASINDSDRDGEKIEAKKKDHKPPKKLRKTASIAVFAD